MLHEDCITVLDSSDDEYQKPTKTNFKVPIIVHVESTSEKVKKPPIVTHIGDCTLTLAKRRKIEPVIEIIDSDDENQKSEKYVQELSNCNSFVITSSIETFTQNDKNVSCQVNTKVPLTSIGNNRRTEINISVIDTPNKKSVASNKECNKYNAKLNSSLPKEECFISLIDDSDSNSETEAKSEFKKETQDKVNTTSNNSSNKINEEIKKPSLKEEDVKEKSNLSLEPSNLFEQQKTRVLSDLNPKINLDTKDFLEISKKCDKISIPSEDVFNQFLLACKEIENSDRMDLIIDKIKKYYNSAHSGYINSNEFLDLIKKTSENIKKSKDYFLHIKDFIEELRARKVLESNKSQSDQECEKDFESKGNKKSRIRKLEKAMKKIIQALKVIEEKEVDLDDESNSMYLRQDRYERRMIKIYNKLCELTGEHPHAGRAIKRKFNVAIGQYPTINKAVQDLINKKKEFPDYHDILKIVKMCNAENCLKMTSIAEGTEARKIFEHIGSELQRRRQADFYLSISDYLQAETDPAEQDPILSSKLKQNYDEYKHKIPEVINKYVEKAELMGAKEEEVLSDQVNSEDNKESEDEDDESDKSITDVTDIKI